MDAPLFVLCIVAFLCLLPLAMYCLVMAYLNHRERPTLVPGSWDAVGLLLGVSGFLAVGGPLLLSAVDAAWREAWFRGSLAQIRAGWERSGGVWVGVWAAYYLGVVGFALWLIAGRRSVTAIYNVDASMIMDSIDDVAGALGRACRPQTGGFAIGPGGGKSDSFVLDVERFPGMRHATLRWTDATPADRLDWEIELAEALRRATPARNPASQWLFTAAWGFFFLMLFCLVFMASFVFIGPA